MEIIKHIVGTRKPLNLRLSNSSGFLDLSNCTVTFRGMSDNRQIEQSFEAAALEPNVVRLLITEIVDESKDKFARGRFHLEFPGGEKYASHELYVEVKQ